MQTMSRQQSITTEPTITSVEPAITTVEPAITADDPAITEEDRWLGELVAAVRQRGLTKAGLEAMG